MQTKTKEHAQRETKKQKKKHVDFWIVLPNYLILILQTIRYQRSW